MILEELLELTKFSTRKTAENLRTQFEKNGELSKMMIRYKNERKAMKDKYPTIENEIEVMKKELLEYLTVLVSTIKQTLGTYIPYEKMQKLENLIDPNNIVVINKPDDKHDFSADSELGKVIANLSKIAPEEEKDFYDKLVVAKGLLPHEIFHMIIKILKADNQADDRMIIELQNGEIITSRGMVGFILNEGMVEKLSSEFCEFQERKYPNQFYHSIAPQYIPYVNICNYLIQSNPNINLNTIFSINYETCLSGLTEEERKKYYEAECISFAVRHKGKKAEEIKQAHIEKIKLEEKQLH